MMQPAFMEAGTHQALCRGCRLLLVLAAAVAPASPAPAMEVPPERVLDHEATVEVWRKLARKHVDMSAAAHDLREAAAVGDLAEVRMLIEKRKVSPDAANQFGKTALMIAAGDGSTRIVRMLLDMGADVTLKNKAGKTALDLAAAAGHDTVTAMLHAAAKR